MLWKVPSLQVGNTGNAGLPLTCILDKEAVLVQAKAFGAQ